MIQNIISKLICRNGNNTIISLWFCGLLVCCHSSCIWSRHSQLAIRFKVASYMQLVPRELNSKLVISIGSIFVLLPLIVAWGHDHSTFCSWVKSSVPGHYLADLATEREHQLTTAHPNQPTGLTNGRVANWAPEVTSCPFPSSTEVPFCC